MCYGVLQCVAVCCSELQCVAVSVLRLACCNVVHFEKVGPLPEACP